MKKSFIIYTDSLSVIDKMTDQQIGKLFKKMRSYHNGNKYNPNDILVDVAFEWFKNQFDRDLKKYKNVCERNKKNWKKWGRPKKQENPNGYFGNPKIPRKPDNDSDNDSDKDNDKDNDKDTSIIINNKENKFSIKKKEYWNNKINEVIKKIKESVEKNWLMYKKGKYERQRANNILTSNDFWEVCAKNNMTRWEFCENIISISTKSDFWAWKIYNCETLYRHYAVVFNDCKNILINNQKNNVKFIVL